MNSVDLNYRTLLSVTNELNSQRDSTSLFRAITDQLAHIIRWERAGVTVYDSDSDAFKFYAVETNLSRVVLRRDARILARAARWDGSMIISASMCDPIFASSGVSEDDCYLEEGSAA
ncbi:MAG: hypothetical protein U0361_20575 [Nitrospiraceae bacterium]